MKPVGIRFRLSELGARFLIRCEDTLGVRYLYVPKLEHAHGVNFLCPKCYQANKGPKGTHRVTCWFVGKVPDDANPGPARWQPCGSSLEDLTFVPLEVQPKTSVKLEGGCRWHGHIIGGAATVIP